MKKRSNSDFESQGSVEERQSLLQINARIPVDTLVYTSYIMAAD